MDNGKLRRGLEAEAFGEIQVLGLCPALACFVFQWVQDLQRVRMARVRVVFGWIGLECWNQDINIMDHAAVGSPLREGNTQGLKGSRIAFQIDQQRNRIEEGAVIDSGVIGHLLNFVTVEDLVRVI